MPFRKVIKHNNSCMITLPIKYTDELNIKPGDKVNIYGDGDRIVISKADAMPQGLEAFYLKGMKQFECNANHSEE